jgi:hypothetical protein
MALALETRDPRCVRTPWPPTPGASQSVTSVARAIVGAMIVASALTACGSSPPTTGVLTGRVAACTEYAFQHPTIVSVYAHDRLVATKRLPGAGRTFRFTLSRGGIWSRTRTVPMWLPYRRGEPDVSLRSSAFSDVGESRKLCFACRVWTPVTQHPQPDQNRLTIKSRCSRVSLSAGMHPGM